MIRFPPVTSAAMPVTTNDMANVAISELIRKYVAMTPFTAPTAMPTAMPMRIAGTGFMDMTSLAVTTWASA